MYDLCSRLASLRRTISLSFVAAALLTIGCDKTPIDEQGTDDAKTSQSCPDGTSYGDGCPPAELDAEQRVVWLTLACENSQQPACGILAGHLLTGKGIDKDVVRARDLAQQACDADVWTGCNTLGLVHIQGNPANADPKKARSLFSKACDHEDGEACKNLALMYARGMGGDEDQRRALQLYQRSCDLGFQPACKVVERMEAMDRERATAALDRALKACEDGQKQACARAGELLLFGSAGEPDRERGLALLDESCGSGVAAACRTLATAFYAGKGVEPNAERARIFAERGCALDEFDACNILGLLYMLELGPDVDIKRARDILERACSAENPRACGNLGRAYLMESEDAPTRPDKAREALEFACDHAIRGACERLERLRQN